MLKSLIKVKVFMQTPSFYTLSNNTFICIKICLEVLKTVFEFIEIPGHFSINGSAIPQRNSPDDKHFIEGL